MLNPKVYNAANWLNDNGLNRSLPLELAVVCGSGLAQGMDEFVTTLLSWNYADIPGFPLTTVVGHGGQLILGKFLNSNKLVLAFSGRIHLYEGISPDELLFQVRLVNALNIKNLILTCSVGSLLSKTAPGSLGLIRDHLDFQQIEIPLLNKHPMSNMYPIYNQKLMDIISDAALDNGVKLVGGTFCSVMGPTYETPAEAQMLRSMGCNWVSMSTTKEATEARNLGLCVAGIAGIANVMKTNQNYDTDITHDEVMEISKQSSKALWDVLSAAVEDLG